MSDITQLVPIPVLIIVILLTAVFTWIVHVSVKDTFSKRATWCFTVFTVVALLFLFLGIPIITETASTMTATTP